MKLFIDTNVFLSFYHLSSDDLEELKKLAVLLDQRKIELFLPRQVIDEFRRNREVKIADALKRFSEEKLNDVFPQICKEYEEYSQMREAISIFKEKKSKLLEKLRAEIESETLKADKIILELFGKATKIEVGSEIISRVRWRMLVGNPPGKNNSSGDAINWECLLEKAPDGKALFFITDDGDYSSPVDESEFLPFLQKEWAERKNAKILYFNRISAFFRSKFPDIRLASELEKELLIRSLASSPNFATSRNLIKQLVDYADFTATQLNDIVQAAITNNQVSWIAGDDDINEYLRKLINRREGKIDPGALKNFKDLLGGAKPSEPAKTDDIEALF